MIGDLCDGLLETISPHQPALGSSHLVSSVSSCWRLCVRCTQVITSNQQHRHSLCRQRMAFALAMRRGDSNTLMPLTRAVEKTEGTSTRRALRQVHLPQRSTSKSNRVHQVCGACVLDVGTIKIQHVQGEQMGRTRKGGPDADCCVSKPQPVGGGPVGCPGQRRHSATEPLLTVPRQEQYLGFAHDGFCMTDRLYRVL